MNKYITELPPKDYAYTNLADEKSENRNLILTLKFSYAPKMERGNCVTVH